MICSLSVTAEFYYLDARHIKMGTGRCSHRSYSISTGKFCERKNVITTCGVLNRFQFQVLIIIVQALQVSFYAVQPFDLSMFTSMINAIGSYILTELIYVARH